MESMGWDRPDPERKTDRFERALQERHSDLKEGLEELLEAKRPVPSNKGAEKGITYLVLQGDSLLHWSSNKIPEPDRLRERSEDGPFFRLRNACYLGRAQKQKGKTYLAIALIKKDHDHENRYLQDRFFKGSGLPPSTRILKDPTDAKGTSYAVHLDDKAPLFHLTYPSDRGTGNAFFWLAILLNAGGIFAFLLFLYQLEKALSERSSPIWVVPGILVLLASIRQFTLLNHFPGIWHRSELFSPTLYAASDTFPTLGDMALNGLLLLFAAFLLHRRFKDRRFPNTLPKAILFSIPATLIAVAFGFWAVELIRGLVENSNIFFDLNQPFRLSTYSLIGSLAVGFLLFALFLITDLLLKWTQGEGKKLIQVIAGAILASFIFSIAFGVERTRALLPLVLILSTGWVHYRRNGHYAFPQAILILAVFAFFSASIFSFYSSLKEKQNREVLAEKLADDEDPMTDLRFDELEDALASDSTLLKAVKGNVPPDKIRQKLEREYLRGYWNEYRVNAYLFDEAGDFVLRLNDHSSRSMKELEELRVEQGSPTDLSDHLYYVHRSPDLVNYVGRIPLAEGRFYVELMSRQVPRELGFPSLLLRERSDMVRELRNYSYGRFLEGRLVDRAGRYSYRRELSAYKDLEKQRDWSKEGGYEHLFYRTGQGSAIVLSKPTQGRLAKATTFSYLFIFFSVLLLLFVAIKDLSKGFGAWQLSLKGKVRFLMVGITLASVLIFALVTRSYVQEQYRAKNEQQLLEKTRSILLELDDKIGKDPNLRPSIQGYTEHTLSELSNVFFTDINLYAPEGELFATSREKIFKEGLSGRYIHPAAYRSLRSEKKSEFVQKERIGQMEHLSAYMPLSNEDGELLGYLNLPYFAKQNELEQELSTFFVAILNIFVLLFALSLVSALFISNWVTRPLRRLQESLSGIELRGSNDPLEYQGNDEIGELVDEYNRKVAELEEKADALARSEREGAWREMAKQVAHEIKNPLTTMRLQLQQLKRSGEGMDPEQVGKVADRLIERIDNLSRIAGEFSHFAEMPRARQERTDLERTIEGTIALYEGRGKLSIELQKELEETPYVIADPDQLSQVFSNLLINAIDAIPEGREGRILFRIVDEGERWKVEVEDNGSGVPEEVRERIFEPKFTTRGQGSGLGLAISKNILEMNGGSIELSSTEGKGSCFVVRLPKAPRDA